MSFTYVYRSEVADFQQNEPVDLSSSTRSAAGSNGMEMPLPAHTKQNYIPVVNPWSPYHFSLLRARQFDFNPVCQHKNNCDKDTLPITDSTYASTNQQPPPPDTISCYGSNINPTSQAHWNITPTVLETNVSAVSSHQSTSSACCYHTSSGVSAIGSEFYATLWDTSTDSVVNHMSSKASLAPPECTGSQHDSPTLDTVVPVSLGASVQPTTLTISKPTAGLAEGNLTLSSAGRFIDLLNSSPTGIEQQAAIEVGEDEVSRPDSSSGIHSGRYI